jgi:hypothetical protein
MNDGSIQHVTWRTPLCHALERAQKAEAEVAEIKESFAFVMSEKCPEDEIHCGCVPILRAENTKLRDLLERALNGWHLSIPVPLTHNDTIYRAAKLAELRSEYNQLTRNDNE